LVGVRLWWRSGGGEKREEREVRREYKGGVQEKGWKVSGVTVN